MDVLSSTDKIRYCECFEELLYGLLGDYKRELILKMVLLYLMFLVEMLEDYVDFVTGVEPGSKNYHEKLEENDIPFIRVGDLGSRDNLFSLINPFLKIKF